MCSVFDKNKDNLNIITFEPKTLKLKQFKSDNLDLLENIHSLTELDLSEMHINEDNFDKYYKIIINNPSLTTLNLYDNNLYNHELEVLGLLLMNENCVLTELNLGFNEFDDEGAISLSKSLEVNKSLTKLDLSKNNISDDGMIALSNMVKVNKTLKHLDLYGDSKISEKTLLVMLDALKTNNTLTYIGLGLEHGKYPLQLDMYNMFNTRPNDETVKAICDVITTNKTLKTLWLTYNFGGKLDVLYNALTQNNSIGELGVYHVMFKPWDSDRIMCNYGDNYEYAYLNYDVDNHLKGCKLEKKPQIFKETPNYANKIDHLLKSHR